MLGLALAVAALAFLIWETWNPGSGLSFSLVIVGKVAALAILVVSVYLLARSIPTAQLHSQKRLSLLLQEANQQLEQEAIHDHVTGLYNRRILEARLQEELAQSGRYGRPCSLLLIDVDRLKYINDKHGHAAGD